MSDITCSLCFRHCQIQEGQSGFCRARKNQNGSNVCAGYGLISAVAMDPVEKKPLRQFYPGSKILSFGSVGCNMRCGFCQNHTISMPGKKPSAVSLSVDDIVERIVSIPGNLGAAFTYNEPLLTYELIRDVAERIHPYGKKIVVVTNGCFSEELVMEILPFVDAFNVDLKGDEEFYRELGGDYFSVKRFIEIACQSVHLEVTTLIVPGKNNDPEWLETEAKWLASLRPGIPLHITRYFPANLYSLPPAEPEEIDYLREIAAKHLESVYTGNIW